MLDKTFYSNGKLLITGEYLVLDGAKSLALPTKLGQNLVVKNINKPQLIWNSFDEKNKLWFNCIFNLPNLDIVSTNQKIKITQTLQNILKEAQKLNPKILNIKTGFSVKTKLNFPRNWGLGTSSTLINNIAQWANINAFDLLNNSFGGSGYDIACAQNNSPILYQLVDKKPIIETVNFNPIFKDQLYFVYLNKKQNSKEAIFNYYKNKNDAFAPATQQARLAEEITQITNAIIRTKKITDFEKLLKEHEKIIASIIKQKSGQQELFSDYFGQTKSLGAWGGDFILATGNQDSLKYFKNKGFETVIPYQDMVL